MRAAALLTMMLASTPALAADDLSVLLDGIGSAARRGGRVEVTAALDATGGSTALTVVLTPIGGAKLPADPGVTVTPVARAGLAWANPAPASEIGELGTYLTKPPRLRLPFTATTAGPVEATVEYAYCIVAEQCLFGETTVSVPVGAAPAG